MRSRANLKSHPIHPMLIGFPLSFFVGAFVFDLLFFFSGNNDFQLVGYYLVIAGIIGAVMAAIPGFVDYLHTVPPESSAKKRAATHGLINSFNLLLFVAVFFLKKNAALDFGWILLLEAIGIGLLAVAGWMGGTLVYRNQIGVDVRYAAAGKWKEEKVKKTGELVKVAALNELERNQLKLVHVNGQRVVIARKEEGYVAFSDACTHKGGSLAGGSMICGTVQCP